MEIVKQWANKAMELFWVFPEYFTVVFGLLVTALLITVMNDMTNRRLDEERMGAIPRRRGRMLRKARRQFVDALITDDFTDRIEQRVYDGEITREEAKGVYLRLKKLFPVRNIFPSPELLKAAIKKRCEAGIHKPVKLPDMAEKPAEEKKKRTLFDKVA